MKLSFVLLTLAVTLALGMTGCSRSGANSADGPATTTAAAGSQCLIRLDNMNNFFIA